MGTDRPTEGGSCIFGQSVDPCRPQPGSTGKSESPAGPKDRSVTYPTSHHVRPTSPQRGRGRKFNGGRFSEALTRATNPGNQSLTRFEAGLSLATQCSSCSYS